MTEAKERRTERAKEREVAKRWPNDPSFKAFKAPTSVFLKADCSESVFKNVLLAAAGSTFLQKYENKMHQSKKNIKNASRKLHV